MQTVSSASDPALSAIPPTVVLIHAPWCGYCQRLRPDWDALVAHLASHGVQGLRVMEFDLGDLPQVRKEHPELMEALEREEHGGPVRSVPHVAFAQGHEAPQANTIAAAPNSGRNNNSNSTVLNLDDAYHGEERPRSMGHMLRFLRDGMAKAVKAAKTMQGVSGPSGPLSAAANAAARRRDLA